MNSKLLKGNTIQLIKGKEKIAEVIFTSAIILELIVMMTDHLASWTIPYRGRVTHVAFILFCIKILMTKYEWNQIIMILLTGMLGVASYFTCKDEYVIRAVVFLAATVGVETDRNIRIIFWGTLIGMLLIIALAVLGVCGTVVDVRDYGRGLIEARYCLGFNHANNVHCLLWYIVALLVLFKYDCLKVWHLICLFVLNIGVYFLTSSRTGVMATAIVIIMAIVIKVCEKPVVKRLYMITAFMALVSCIIISLRAATVVPFYDRYQMTLNRLLTQRLEMVWEHMPMSTWVIFPGPRTSEYVDNGFVSLTYIYGTVVGILFCVLIVYSIYESYKKDMMYVMIVLISSIFVVFMESTCMINISILCNMILILGMVINGKIDKKNR